MRPLIVRAACVLSVALTLGACSSSSKQATGPTTTVTSPPPTAKVRAQVRAYLAGPGKALLKFEHLSSMLIDGQDHTRQECRNLATLLKKQVGVSPLSLDKLWVKIPDETLRFDFHDDIWGKNLLIAACIETTKSTGFQRDTPVLHQRLVSRLAQYGIKI
jgi:hypothetical protein